MEPLQGEPYPEEVVPNPHTLKPHTRYLLVDLPGGTAIAVDSFGLAIGPQNPDESCPSSNFDS